MSLHMAAEKNLGDNEIVQFRPKSCRVAVIGAGASGLIAARELVREGHTAVVFEQEEEVGGVWVYNPKVESDPLGIDSNRTRVGSSIYPSLRTNLPREVMGFLDFPFTPKKGQEGRDDRHFPSHTEVAFYLKEFAEYYNVRELVRFGVKVEYLGREASEGTDIRWVVKSRRSNELKVKETDLIESQQVEVFDAVVVCSGHYAEPKIVEIPGVESWPGFQIHSHNYRHPERFQDQVVIVIGNGQSAHDISREVASLAKEVHTCAREWTPLKQITQLHNMQQHPMVEKAYADGTVKFQDGTSTVADTIIYCTGYLYSFPFLDTDGYISVDDNRVHPLYKHVFLPSMAPTLSFIGLVMKAALFPVFELQSRWVARVLSGKGSLPSQSEMTADIMNLYDDLEAKNLPKNRTHNIASYFAEYEDWLLEQNGDKPMVPWRRELFVDTFKAGISIGSSYRDQWDKPE